jgi:dipeptidyl aminopeptidase/acylaminoacyl peptidase
MRNFKILCLFSAIFFICNYTLTAFAALPTLIPRSVLFGNPVKTMPSISPNGLSYAYLAPSKKGVLNIWVQDIQQKQAAKMVTNDQHRGIRHYHWAPDNQHILYMQDNNGDENFHLYSVNLKNIKTHDLTPFIGVKVENFIIDKHFPQQILIGMNKRDRKVFDMYRVDLATGKLTLDTINPGDVVGWLADDKFQIRAAMASNNKDASTQLRVRDTVNDQWRTLISWPFGENGSAVDFTKDGKHLYITNSLDSNTTQLQTIAIDSGKIMNTIATNPKSDLDGIFMDDDTHQIQAVAFNYLKPEWQVLDPKIEKDFARLKNFSKDKFVILNRDNSQQKWLFAVLPDNASSRFYSYDRQTGKIKLLFTAKPALQKYQLAKMQALIIPARDGKQLVSYLSLPVGIPAKKLPLILNVHGGPWARDTWGYDAEAQWLTNRGYAVLQVNFRGSTGFGKEFLNAGNGQWGRGDMQHDLTDAVQWAIQNGIADPKRICIYGGSYGGYAVLAGLTFTPNLYACGVDIVGPANLQTLMASIPPYWESGKKEMLLRIGDVEKDDEFNKKISPIFHVQQIKSPLLIAQGANDPRVNVNQAETIVNAMRAKKLNVSYLLYTDEGHGFARPENRLDFYARAEAFLAKHLSGRKQAWQKVKNANVIAKE